MQSIDQAFSNPPRCTIARRSKEATLLDQPPSLYVTPPSTILLTVEARLPVPDDAQPALISYVPTYGDMVISDEETLTNKGLPVMPTTLPDFDGACDCNLDGCRPPDLGAYEHLRPRWIPRIEGSVDRRRKREEPNSEYVAGFVGPASKRPKVKKM